MIILATTAGGEVVAKSKASPLKFIPSLSTRNMGRVFLGVNVGFPRFLVMTAAYSLVGMTVEMSAPVVVVPLVLDPVTNMVSLPERREAIVDLPTALLPTRDVMEIWVLNSGMSWVCRSLQTYFDNLSLS